jgi:hypothetical protein
MYLCYTKAMKRRGNKATMATTIKIQKGNNEPKFLPNCEIVNGKIVGVVGAEKYRPYWNGHKIEAAGKKAETMALGTTINAAQVAKFSDFLFSLGENEGGYMVEVYVAPPKPKYQSMGSIFGASSDGSH